MTGSRDHDPFDLERFLVAQASGVYARALEELQDGRKRSHWMWFVFPQLAGLGRSATAQHFAVSGLDEARAYLQHPVLGVRLRESVSALLGLPGTDPVAVLGSIDAVKLRSSMTLFARAAPEGEIFQQVLDRYFGGLPDEATIRLLGSP
ncbi:MAG: hypothetical protein QOF53_447 [Nocardioidaceae bacterium]|nr:hypothetical protein [Nocardioidaceae bacterium]